jgi:ATP-dependent DNA helicase RecQ
MKERIYRVLRDVFGFADFKPGQRAVIEHLTSGQDALVVMATGAGKSLCYQLPAIVRPGMGLVVSPLVALMQQQTRRLAQLGVRVACLHSGLDWREERDIESQMKAGELDLLFMSPERACSRSMQRILRGLELSLVAIDEAHCVWQWGFDFRPEYGQLRTLLDELPGVPRIALTATASPECREAIVDQLNLRQAKVFESSIDRPNLFLWMQPRKQAVEQLWTFIQSRHRNHAGIVYCQTRKQVEQTAVFLRARGLSVASYHAGLTPEQRRRTEDDFLSGDVAVIVATIAFGMGIDKPDVRFVAHMALPRSIEAYYQEIGRAGRDGKPADAWLLYGLKDLQMQLRWIQDSGAPAGRKSLERALSQRLLALALSHECRRKHLLEAFGEQATDACGHCDNCVWPIRAEDAREEAKKALSAVFRVGQGSGVGHLVRVLRGSLNRAVRERHHHELSVFGIGAEHSETWWQLFFLRLWAAGAIDFHGEHADCVRLLPACKPLLAGRVEVLFAAPRSHAVRHYTANPLHDEPVVTDIIEPLRQLRLRLAEEYGVPVYEVLNDVQMQELSRSCPQDMGALVSIPGFSKLKRDRYGPAILEVIEKYRERCRGEVQEWVRRWGDGWPDCVVDGCKEKEWTLSEFLHHVQRWATAGVSGLEVFLPDAEQLEAIENLDPMWASAWRGWLAADGLAVVERYLNTTEEKTAS